MESNIFEFTRISYCKRAMMIMFQNLLFACFDIFILYSCVAGSWLMIAMLGPESAAKDYIMKLVIGVPMLLGFASLWVIIPRSLYSKYLIYRVEANDDSVTFHYLKYNRDLELTIPKDDLKVDFFFNKRGPYLGGVSVSQKEKGYRAKEKICQFFVLDLRKKTCRRKFADFILHNKIKTNLEKYPVVL